MDFDPQRHCEEEFQTHAIEFLESRGMRVIQDDEPKKAMEAILEELNCEANGYDVFQERFDNNLRFLAEFLGLELPEEETNG